MSAVRARRYSPIFTATVTPNDVQPLTTVTGKAYTRCTATISRPGKPVMTRSVLAFGKSNVAVRDLLVPGKPVELAIQLDGGSAKIIGLPRPKAVVANEVSPMTELEAGIKEISTILTMVDIHPDLHEEIIQAMLTGEYEGPAEEADDDGDELRALVHQTQGHILFPLIDAGVDYRTACRAVDLIRDLAFSWFLDDLRTLREQAAARGLLFA